MRLVVSFEGEAGSCGDVDMIWRDGMRSRFVGCGCGLWGRTRSRCREAFVIDDDDDDVRDCLR